MCVFIYIHSIRTDMKRECSFHNTYNRERNEWFSDPASPLPLHVSFSSSRAVPQGYALHVEVTVVETDEINVHTWKLKLEHKQRVNRQSGRERGCISDSFWQCFRKQSSGVRAHGPTISLGNKQILKHVVSYSSLDKYSYITIQIHYIMSIW